MEIARQYALLSTCLFTYVGAIIVNPVTNRIISHGYNGVDSGKVHCCDINDHGMDRALHGAYADRNETHAEMNALIFAKEPVDGAVCYTTVQPCLNCTKHLSRAGIIRIYYDTPYWRLENETYHDFLPKTEVIHLI